MNLFTRVVGLCATLGIPACGQQSTVDSSASTSMQESLYKDKILATGKIVSTYSGPDRGDGVSGTRIDIQFTLGGVISFIVDEFRQDTDTGHHNPNTYWTETYRVTGTVKRNAAGQPLSVPAMREEFGIVPLYELRTMASADEFPETLAVTTTSYRLFGTALERSRICGPNRRRLIVPAAEPPASVSFSVPANFDPAAKFQVVGKRTVQKDEMGRPVYNLISYTPLPYDPPESGRTSVLL